ncbi:MAG: NAD(+)/NADH kinase [Chlamydiae bacterium]|nr:NAD(+)/NADH kinase [Chlamydiota bacterium]MBI3266255.1 NAD(+)/NADH kinase [Chlamydiota bacterium]
MKIAILSNPHKIHAPRVVGKLLKKISRKKDVMIFLDRFLALSLARKDLYRTDTQLTREADILVALGGDGTLLQAVKRVSRPNLPVLGVNLGGLGFLTEFSAAEFLKGFGKILKSDFEIDERETLQIRRLRKGGKERSYEALNDAVITKGALSRMLSLDVFVDEEYLTTYRSDGLIVATPTGSTAHSLSGGGPIVVPHCQVMLITPICPHTLSNRPLVLSHDQTVRVQLTSSSQGVGLTLDGQLGLDLKEGDAVEIKEGARTIPLIRLKNCYFEILREKLGWRGTVTKPS